MTTPQHSTTVLPWNEQEIGDLSGLTAVVTGGSAGVGLAVTERLARAGARVLIGARDLDRARAAADGVGGQVESAALDLEDPESVRSFAAWVRERTGGPDGGGVDLLVNNAGISNPEFGLARATRVERQFAVNHLGHFALTGLLLPLLVVAEGPRAGGARVVTVSSSLYEHAPLDLSRLADPEGYSPGLGYVRSKLANVLFATELDRRLAATANATATATGDRDRTGARVRSLVAHPGLARTPMHDTYPSPETTEAVRQALAVSGRDPHDAVIGILHAALAPQVSPDAFYGPGGEPGTPSEHVTAEPLRALALDAELAAALWKASEQLSGVSYAQ